MRRNNNSSVHRSLALQNLDGTEDQSPLSGPHQNAQQELIDYDDDCDSSFVISEGDSDAVSSDSAGIPAQLRKLRHDQNYQEDAN